MFVLVSVRLGSVQQLSVETQSEGSVRVRWRAVSGARAYRLVWGPFTGKQKVKSQQQFSNTHNYILFFVCVHWGRNVETVEVPGDSEFHILSRLQRDTEYIITIIPLYEGNTEGPVATARFKIGMCAACCSLQHKTSLFFVNVSHLILIFFCFTSFFLK